MRRGTKKALADLYAEDAKDEEPKQADKPKEANKKEKEKETTHSEPFMKALELKRQNAFYGENQLNELSRQTMEEQWPAVVARIKETERQRAEQEFLDKMMLGHDEEEEGEISSL